MMNWISVLCVAVFLGCRHSVGYQKSSQVPCREKALSPEEFYNQYYYSVATKINEEMRCRYIRLTYHNGTSEVCTVFVLDRVYLSFLNEMRLLCLI